MKNSFWSIWAMPTANQSVAIQKIIDELKERYDGPSFQPHLTLAGYVEGSLERIKKKCSQLKDSVEPVSVPIAAKMNYTDSFFQSLFIEVEKERKLVQLSATIVELLGADTASFRPHISVYYGYLDTATKKKEIDNTIPKIKLFRLLIDRVFIVACDHERLKWDIKAEVVLGK